MLFFRLRWFREEREETTDRYVLNLICDLGWLSNLILQKQDHSQSRGMGPISPKLLSVGASSPTVCPSRWLDQSLLSLLEKLLEGFSGLCITCIGGSHKETEACRPTGPSVPESSQPTWSWSSAELSPSHLNRKSRKEIPFKNKTKHSPC